MAAAYLSGEKTGTHQKGIKSFETSLSQVFIQVLVIVETHGNAACALRGHSASQG